MLRCRDHSLYTGITNDLDKRLRKHNRGKASRYTRVRLPVDIVYVEECEDKSTALRREKEIKGYKKSDKEKMVMEAGIEDPLKTMDPLL
ncbi:GIY-YIG nuclease family protein [Ammoniphilus sp. 3BR4]|uniref:GIY-YIG nuclease family protein n=1 Tax=Ammoniphilus sp. 3BR4 TaxID=3158265 RepID=UPI0034673671